VTEKPKKPLGKALVRTEEDLDRLAEITPGDMEATLAEVEPATRALLEATPEEDKS
jgi:hypothetical protein